MDTKKLDLEFSNFVLLITKGKIYKNIYILIYIFFFLRIVLNGQLNFS